MLSSNLEQSDFSVSIGTENLQGRQDYSLQGKKDKRMSKKKIKD